MKLSIALKNNFVYFACLILSILFTYAALSKLLEFQNFQAQLGQSPLLSAYTGFISYFILIVELLVAILLVIPKTRYIALFASFAIMFMFTVYIIVILNYSSFIPCSCGGILEQLGWKEHLLFNIGFTILSTIAILIVSTDIIDTIIKLLIITLTGSTLIIALYITSENAMHSENPFIRRFIQGSSSKKTQINLNNNTLYFAGTYNNTIFLGDYKAPLHIFTFDTLLKSKKHYKIQLEREDFPFQSVQVKIFENHFYLMDGTVPVIYKGNLSNWKAKLILCNNNYYFNKAEIIAPDKIAFRAQALKTRQNILGTFSFSKTVNVDYATNLLQKQIDGFFDTDGMLQYDKQAQKFIYLYYYRNQFIVTDTNLKIQYKGNTIDTTTHANIKVAYIKNTSQRKLAAPPFTVNQLSTVNNDMLFVNSKLIGKYEPKEMWKEASIIDIYNIKKKIYKSSIYIYNSNKSKVSDMILLNNNLYVIIGHELHKYHLSNQLLNKS